MIKRHVQALAAGVIVGIVLQEGAWRVFDALAVDRSLDAALAAGAAAANWLPAALAAWLLGGFAGGLMASLIGGTRVHGYATGLLLAGSGLLLTGLAWPDSGAFQVIGAAPLPAAVAGAALAERIRATPARTGATDADTLRAGH